MKGLYGSPYAAPTVGKSNVTAESTIVPNDITQDELEDQLSNDFDDLSGSYSHFIGLPRLPLPHLNFSEIIFPHVNWSSWGSVPDDAGPPDLQRTYHGLFDELCDEAITRFWKLGRCLAKTPQYKELNETFWFQAARQELCGYDMTLPGTAPTGDGLPPSNIMKPGRHENKFNYTTRFGSFIQHLWNNSVKLPEFNYPLYDETVSSQVVPSRKTISSPAEIAKQKDIIRKETKEFNAELKAEYLYLLRQAYTNSLAVVTSEMVKRMGEEHGLPELSERSIGDILGLLPGLLGPIAGGATLTKGACLALCDTLRQGSNTVDNCWLVTGLSVLYGVCSAGCVYYVV